jgi:hypothetical protein
VTDKTQLAGLRVMESEVVVAVTNGGLDFGTWERIFQGQPFRLARGSRRPPAQAGAGQNHRGVTAISQPRTHTQPPCHGQINPCSLIEYNMTTSRGSVIAGPRFDRGHHANMSEILQEISAPALVTAIEENWFEHFRLFQYWSQAEVHDGPTLLWTISDIRFIHFNGVLRAQLTPEHVDATIEAATTGCRSRNVPLLRLRSNTEQSGETSAAP